MIADRFVCSLFATLLLAPFSSAAQNSAPSAPSPSQSIRLDVAVDTGSGQPVTDLQQQDFTILDNKSPRPITSFKVMTPADERVEVILFIDAVNTPREMIENVRNSAVAFLKENGGKLAHPTIVAVFTDAGIQTDNSFSTDGNSLGDALAHREIGLRQIARIGPGAENALVGMSLNALNQFVAYAATLPGRKLIVFISPGWPLLSGQDVTLSSKQEQQIFGNIVFFSSQLRQAGITLYDINPLGASVSVDEADYYKTFLKPVLKPSEAQFAHLSLQMLSLQSGGLTALTTSDISGQIHKCLADADSWYEITFDPLPSGKPNDYHKIEIKLDRPGLIARTNDNYYANTTTAQPGH